MHETAAHIANLSRSPIHEFSKEGEEALRLLAGFGVEGDAHAGDRVQHRSRVAVDPTQTNLRQVHLLHAELLHELNKEGFTVGPGQLGENILTEGLDLLDLPTDTRLLLGNEAEIEITGLRNPCKQIDSFAPNLLRRLAYRDESGEFVRLAGVMGVVLTTGEIRIGDAIRVRLPDEPHRPLAPV
jgi:MOSC domain-containing protein YiiM